MKSASQYTAKILFLVSLVIALASAYYGYGLSQSVASTLNSINFAKQDESKARLALDDMKKLLPGNETAADINKEVESLMTSLQDARLDARVTILSMTPDSTTRSAANTQAVGFSPVGGTRLLSATLTIKGVYADYEGLTSFLSTVRSNPVSITKLKIDGVNFELSVMVFGKAG